MKAAGITSDQIAKNQSKSLLNWQRSLRQYQTLASPNALKKREFINKNFDSYVWKEIREKILQYDKILNLNFIKIKIESIIGDKSARKKILAKMLENYTKPHSVLKFDYQDKKYFIHIKWKATIAKKKLELEPELNLNKEGSLLVKEHNSNDEIDLDLITSDVQRYSFTSLSLKEEIKDQIKLQAKKELKNGTLFIKYERPHSKLDFSFNKMQYSTRIVWEVNVYGNKLDPVFDLTDDGNLKVTNIQHDTKEELSITQEIINELKEKAFKGGSENILFIGDVDGMWSLHDTFIDEIIEKLGCPEEEKQGYKNIFDLALQNPHYNLDIGDLIGSCAKEYLTGLQLKYVNQLIQSSKGNLAKAAYNDLAKQTFLRELKAKFLEAKFSNNAIKMHQILIAISQSIRLIVHYKVDKFFKGFDTHYGYQSDELLIDKRGVDFLSTRYDISEAKVSLRNKFIAAQQFIKIIPHSSSLIRSLSYSSASGDEFLFDLRSLIAGLQIEGREYNKIIKKQIKLYRKKKQKHRTDLEKEIENLIKENAQKNPKILSLFDKILASDDNINFVSQVKCKISKLDNNDFKSSLEHLLQEYENYKVPGEYSERNLFIPVFIFCLSNSRNTFFIPVGLSMPSSFPFMISADLEDNVFNHDIHTLGNYGVLTRREKIALQKIARISSAHKEDEFFKEIVRKKNIEYSDNFLPQNENKYFIICQHSERVFSRILRTETAVQGIVESLQEKLFVRFPSIVEGTKFDIHSVTILAYSLNRICHDCTRDLTFISHDWSNKGFLSLLSGELNKNCYFRVNRSTNSNHLNSALISNCIVIADQQYPKPYDDSKDSDYKLDDGHGLEVARHPNAAIVIVDKVNIHSSVHTNTFIEQFKGIYSIRPRHISKNFFISGSPINDYAGVNDEQELDQEAEQEKFATDTVLKDKSLEYHNNSNLKRAEKYLLFKAIKKSLVISFINHELVSSNNLDTKGLDDETVVDIGVIGKITLISDFNHILLHKHEVQRIIALMSNGPTINNSVICLERKQLGKNLGMDDLINLANYIDNEFWLPDYVKQLPIYYDALLYNAAKAKNVQVIGIEGKGLAYSKESPYYHQAREEYMAQQLLAITSSGKNAIYIVGSAHIDNLTKLLGDQGFRIDVNDGSLGQNLITLKSDQSVLRSSLVIFDTVQHSKINNEPPAIASYPSSSEYSSSQAKEEYFKDKTDQQYPVLEYIHEAIDQSDLTWLFKKRLYSKDIAKFDQIMQKYNIARSVDELKESEPSSYSFSIEIEDKELERDVIFVASLKEKLNLPIGTKEIEYLQPFVYKTNIGIKITDTAIDVARLIYMPTADNAHKTLMGVAHVYSMCFGINGLSLIPLGYAAINKYFQLGLASFGVPYISFAYSVGLTVYSGYSAVLNGYSFYNEFNQKDFKLNSNIAYQNLAEKLSTSFLQNLYDFASKAKEYEKAAYKIRLEEKGELGQKLYEYIYSPMIEEKYDLQSKVTQGILTKGEIEGLKAKHIKVLSYDHCMEIVSFKDGEALDHYYCYDEKQEILDHIVIAEGAYVEIVEQL